MGDDRGSGCEWPRALAALYQARGLGFAYPLIIVDGHMPRMGGIALMERIRAAEDLKVGEGVDARVGRSAWRIQSSAGTEYRRNSH